MIHILSATQALWIFFAPLAAACAIATSYGLSRMVLAQDEGNEAMKKVAGFIKNGAMTYLKRQYQVVAIVFAFLFLILMGLAWRGYLNPFVPFAFLSGGFWSGLSGFLGMKIATATSSRTAQACRISLGAGLKVSFRAGAVMGLLVVGFGLLDLSLWFLALNYIYDHNLFNVSLPLIEKLGNSSWNSTLPLSDLFQKQKYLEITNALLTYSMGSAILALFARLGGGIFTKAADMGADLVGKIEAGMPEDDPRNPATIADNVGDNVCDVAGMGADLYDSYCASILAAAALGASVIAASAAPFSVSKILIPFIIAGIGIFASIIGVFSVGSKDRNTQKEVLRSLSKGTGIAATVVVLACLFFTAIHVIPLSIFFAVMTGLGGGLLIGRSTEYYTSNHFKPTQKISYKSLGGAAPNILQGISTGMLSTAFPVTVIVACILLAYFTAGGAQSHLLGIYGIACASVGMLSILGITLATDAFGPIADNAGGNAAMASLPDAVRANTDTLDAVGNTTAATGKGFAIGSAALTALALLAAYMNAIKLWVEKSADLPIAKLCIGNHGVLTLDHLVSVFKISVLNPQFLGGLLIGAMITFVFCSMTISAVSRVATQMVEEVRRQFSSFPGILTGQQTPDYDRCIDISTAGAQKSMLAPSILAVGAPILIGITCSIAGVVGVILGAMVSGLCLAITLNNAGGAWDNAKKYIETGECGGKGTDAHRASVIGDTVGDPFKDTAGPAINILIKIMIIVSIVFVGVVLRFGLSI